MPQINPTLPTLGDLNLTEDVDVRNALLAIVNAINGGLDKDNLLDGGITSDKLVLAALQALGINSTGVVRRGKSIVATIEARTNTAYGLMATPDRVSGIVLPTDGLIVVLAQMTWQESIAQQAQAALFLNAAQAKYATRASAPPQLQQVPVGSPSNAATDNVLTTAAGGLLSGASGAVGYTGDVTTGQMVGVYSNPGGGDVPLGGPCFIFAAAGTYDISVQFKAASGSVTAKNRKLWAWAIGF